jgi:hypothetical protein
MAGGTPRGRWAKEEIPVGGTKKLKRRQKRSDLVVGVAWYRRQDWQRLLEVSVDREELEESYDEWATAMPARMAEIEQAGFTPHKIDVAVDELISWCHHNGRVVDGPARADFAAHKLRELHMQGKLQEPGA